jgi:rare lipoprotein A (peptidoglycan hydrolase)
MNTNTIRHSLVNSLRGTLLALLLSLGCTPLWAQMSTKDFDHVKTGFVLTGVHSSQRCESCHINGIFKGTPRDCTVCHTSGGRLAAANVIKPQTHFVTQLPCESCHNTATFSGTKFNHVGIAPNSCGTCHNGTTTTGKPSSHIPTIAPCGTCHTTTAWVPTIKPDHSGFTAATICSTCHNGTTATGKPGNHISTTANCITCHSTRAWLPVARPDHSGFTVATNCGSCHNGMQATGKPATHIPTAVNCISCHSATAPAFKPSIWNHTQMPVTNQCSTCHSGSYPPADGKTANHIPYQVLAGVAITNCDTCHKSGYASWNPGLFHSNVSVSTQCATCHLSSVYGVTGKPATAIHASVTGNCENCHKTTSLWAASKPDHGLFNASTICGNCHNGITALGKTPTHIPTAVNCISCHSATAPAFKPSTWNHTQMPVANQCSTCHSGSYPPADGKPSNHIPYQVLSGVVITNCDTCHKTGYVSWFPGKFHSNVTVTSQCSNCHLTSMYGLTSKPNTITHATVTGFCESCHRSTSTWLSVQYTHSPANAVGTGTCDTCHNNVNALGKPTLHIPTGTGKCDACHLGQVTFVSPYKMNHTVVAAMTCTSCHNGTYTTFGPVGAQAMTSISNHVPLGQLLNGTALDCSACHSSTTSFATEKMNHNISQGNGAGWCIGCHRTGTNYQGSMQKMSLTHQSSGKTDCSVGGCHKPLGNTGAAYTKWK